MRSLIDLTLLMRSGAPDFRPATLVRGLLLYQSKVLSEGEFYGQSKMDFKIISACTHQHYGCVLGCGF